GIAWLGWDAESQSAPWFPSRRSETEAAHASHAVVDTCRAAGSLGARLTSDEMRGGQCIDGWGRALVQNPDAEAPRTPTARSSGASRAPAPPPPAPPGPPAPAAPPLAAPGQSGKPPMPSWRLTGRPGRAIAAVSGRH